jgi:hypothetical protein
MVIPESRLSDHPHAIRRYFGRPGMQGCIKRFLNNRQQ